jgi:hypothetical protein
MKHRSRFAASVLAGLVGLGAFLSAGEAAAQEDPPKEGRGVITVAEVTITGRIQRPIAAVDVSRIQPKLTLAELSQPFLERIEKAIYKDPF